ncbi:uncharacterized protein LOC106773939 [Vigna radiata var. radiata]|uniref:Uncharacterized protein LOC106773939 n=1 Tax=Vigna radiata var. radiata TaxID=3916 RepID=A0A1S3VDA7_VIGRR|nr:uncharacterized protein LOC106773939 [Vigna radiata var. radiata]
MGEEDEACGYVVEEGEAEDEEDFGGMEGNVEVQDLVLDGEEEEGIVEEDMTKGFKFRLGMEFKSLKEKQGSKECLCTNFYFSWKGYICISGKGCICISWKEIKKR